RPADQPLAGQLVAPARDIPAVLHEHGYPLIAVMRSLARNRAGPLTRTRIFSGRLQEHRRRARARTGVGELKELSGATKLASAGVLDVQIEPRVPEDRRIAWTA